MQQKPQPTASITCDIGTANTQLASTIPQGADRKALLAQIKAGDVTEVDFEAIVFRAQYPNSNFLRFKDQDLAALAASFVGQPFLRNHDVSDIGARDGTIVDARMIGGDLQQRVRLTTERGMNDFARGLIDRFSIGWYYEGIECSICHADWMKCSHWPGHQYEVDGASATCELIFLNPRGKETSAVNAPAVRGTRVLDDHHESALAQLIQAKIDQIGGKRPQEPTQDATASTPLTPASAPSQSAPDPTQKEDNIMATNVQAPEPKLDASPTGANPTGAIAPDPTPQAATPSAAPGPAPADTLMQWLVQQQAQLDEHLRRQQEQLQEQWRLQQEQWQAQQQAQQTQLQVQQTQLQAWTEAARQASTNSMLSASGLPQEAQTVIRIALGDQPAAPDQVQRLIDAQREAMARVVDNHVVQGIDPLPQNGVRVNGMLSDMDKFKTALFALFNNQRPNNNVKRLNGLREAYMLMSGDYELTGRFIPENVSLANVTSASLPDMMAEWMNQRVVTIWSTYDLWHERYCRIENFASLRDPHWIKIGGLGELSQVGEGSPYTEKEWAAESETTLWTKRGNWLGLTIEAIDRDATGYITQVPQIMAQAAWLTIGKDFTRRLITANGAGYGATMQSDSKATFHADHRNLGNSALAWSAWEATRIAMARQQEINTGEVLGGLTVPVNIMVPRHLETTAITMLATERVLGSGNNDINPLVAAGSNQEARMMAAKSMITVNDYLGTRNDWFAFADPMKFPLFGLGFRWGSSPEIFSMADPNNGLMFTNDTLPIKVRWYYSMGPIDYRGMYYHRVN